MAKIPVNNGLDWGLFPSAAELPNVVGSATQNEDLVTGARAYVPDYGVYTCTDATPAAAVWARTGAIVGGGTGAQVGPFTELAVPVGGAFTVLGLASASAWVVPRAGSITAISAFLSAAATGDVIDAFVLINNAPAFAVSMQDGGALYAVNTQAAGAYPVAAEDRIVVATIGGALLSNTPDLVAFVEFTAG